MIFIPFNYSGGNMTDKSATALLVVCNFLLLISLGITYYLFTIDSYTGTYWDWSWDLTYGALNDKSNAGLAWMFFWLPLFFINGVALVVVLWELTEKIIYGKSDEE